MARDKGNPVAILAAIVNRLIDQIAGLDPASCYWVLDPNALPTSGPGDLLYVVSPLNGSFDEALIIGGGQEQLTADGGFTVRIYSPLQLDQAGQDTHLLTDESKGVMAAATGVIAALADWSPIADGDEQTRDPIFPHGYAFGRPGGKKKRTLGYIELSFTLKFDWDVSADVSP